MIDMVCILFTTAGVLFFAFRAVKLDRDMPWFRVDILAKDGLGPSDQGTEGWRRRGEQPTTDTDPAVPTRRTRRRAAPGATSAMAVRTAASKSDRATVTTRPWQH